MSKATDKQVDDLMEDLMVGHNFEYAGQKLKELLSNLDKALRKEKKEKKEVVELLRLCAEPMRDDCYYDHHGYCQSHFLHNNPCPYSEAKKLLLEKYRITL